MIEVKNLTKRYGATVAVNDVSFDAQAGEVVGFIGPNGAGKTTTMRILTCYLSADAGTAKVAGYDVFEESIEVRKQIGYLPESTPLYTDMGVLDYLNFIAQIRNIPKNQRKKRIKEVIEVCGLGKVIQKDIGELSKGYRQRLGLSQALVHDPSILILDEATSGLDPRQIVEFRSLIKELGKEKMILLSSHILPEVSATCSRILVIDEGHLVANGTPEELAGRAKGQEVVHISIRGPREEIEAKLDELSFVSDYKCVKSDDEILGYRIACQKGKNAVEKISQFVAENHWRLLEAHQETVSLEDVFLQLTSSDSAADESNA